MQCKLDGHTASVMNSARELYPAYAFSSAQCRNSVDCTGTQLYTVHMQCEILFHVTEYTVSAQPNGLIMYTMNSGMNALTVYNVGSQLGPLTAST